MNNRKWGDVWRCLGGLGSRVKGRVRVGWRLVTGKIGVGLCGKVWDGWVGSVGREKLVIDHGCGGRG